MALTKDVQLFFKIHVVPPLSLCVVAVWGIRRKLFFKCSKNIRKLCQSYLKTIRNPLKFSCCLPTSKMDFLVGESVDTLKSLQ